MKKIENKPHCIECGKKLFYYSDPDPISLSWNLGASSHVVALMLNQTHSLINLSHRIMRRDLKGYWFCKKHDSFVIFDVKRYKRKFLLVTNILRID
ncbi:MAG: hypothetical protein K0S93_17 [Nitrososphaeraceae archaeon]|jgi:hypothetical protein|nr:hypothetical protein [Nitrososphaeraceae archaeon]